MKRRLIALAIALTVVSTAAILVYASLDEGEDVVATLKSLPWWLFPAALACHVGAHMMWGARVSLLARTLSLPVGPVTGWALVTAGTFGGAVTPGRVGGEALKLGLLVKQGFRAGRSGRVLLVDRVFDLGFFILLGSGAFFLLPPLFGAGSGQARLFAALGTAVLAGFTFILGLFVASPRRTTAFFAPLVRRVARWRHKDADPWLAKMESFVDDLRSGVAELRKHPWPVLGAAGLTVVNWALEYAALWTVLRGFGADIPYWAVFFAGAVLTLVSNIPATPGGAGVAEAAALALLLPLADGVSPLVVVAWRLTTYDYDLVAGGVLTSVWLPRRAPEPFSGTGQGDGR